MSNTENKAPITDARTLSLLEQRKSARNAQLKTQMKGKISSKMVAQDKIKKVRPTTPKRSSPRIAFKKQALIANATTTTTTTTTNPSTAVTTTKKSHKVPNFDKIFEEQFKKMTSLKDYEKKLNQKKEEVKKTNLEPITATKVETRKRAATITGATTTTKTAVKRKADDSKENQPPRQEVKKSKI